METDPHILTQYRRHVGRKRLFVFSLMAAIGLLGTFSITRGPLTLSIPEVYATLLNRFFPDYFSTPGELAIRAIWYMRLPRLLMGLAAGFNLAIAGAVMQPVLRNPLASPFTLGISAGAGFGAALAIIFGKGLGGGVFFVVINAFVFSLLTAMLILGMSRYKGATPGNMVLAGIALSYLFGAGTTVMQYFADSWAVTEVVFWMVGSLGKSTWSSLRFMLPVMLLCIPYLLLKTRDLNVMNTGDDVAVSLGANVRRARLLILMAASILTAITICFTGAIGFIGLVAPHMARMILGGDNRFVVPAAGLVGALLLSASDLLAMNIIPPTVIPIGIMTAFMGVPLFLYLIMKNRSELWR
ncbi:iron ABC transporter permease [Desulfosarcina ovata subsp. sediminis]|uniref:Iron ABC transporter permease n=1 Tax=Desulfosarcina ovata subsp. sediminis TaxID=885957 RepID=A0A5K7ZLA6_9BACT|nr:iron ABC transporter permease [Desulfosarcina ovata]BBO81846.1 iron ABC transporter permease [Desulfosarcina ovata subsp. sediminis]